MKVIIDDEEYNLENLNGECTTRRGDYVGHYKILAKKGDKMFEVKLINNE